MPVRKSALPTSSAELRAVYDGRRHAKHTLFAGTNILQVTGGTEGPADDAWSGYKPQEAKGNEVMGLVLTTGIDTSKGDLLVLCNGCDVALHTFCITPQLAKLPKGSWYCPRCIWKTQRHGVKLGEEKLACESSGWQPLDGSLTSPNA